MKCNCYVAHLSEYDRFVIRYGAHSLTCPKYRESGDVLDRQRDQEFRARHEVTTLGIEMECECESIFCSHGTEPCPSNDVVSKVPYGLKVCLQCGTNYTEAGYPAVPLD